MADARDRLTPLAHSASLGESRVVLTNHGLSICAVVSMADLELLESLEQDGNHAADVDHGRTVARGAGDGIPERGAAVGLAPKRSR